MPRPTVLDRLQAGLYRRCSLISAPAGFGKTTTTCAWVKSTGLPIAWLSLERVDRATWRFLSYLIASIRHVYPAFASELLGLLASPDNPVLSYLSLLVNEISQLPERFLLVLDDLHLIDTPENTQLLQFLIDHLPTTCHLVLITREAPALPLAQYRLRDQITEVGMRDLKFSVLEAGVFFKEVMHLNLDDDEAIEVVQKTEGWVAGLQAAALSMRQSGGRSASIRSFGGDDQNVLQFLEQEVLDRQPDAVRSFLLQVSIVERMCGSLCDALVETVAPVGEQTLVALDRAQLFLIPLDSQGRWYRVHHLFREMLQQRLQREQADGLGALHLRASRWYREQEDWPAAAEHAIAGRDFGIAAACLERAFEGMGRAWLGERWRTWVEAMPAERVRAHPVLQVQLAHLALGVGAFAASEDYLEQAERGLPDSAGAVPGWAQVPNPDLYASLMAAVAIGRGYLAQAFGDTATTLSWTERVLADDHGDPLRRMQALGLQGLALWTQGDLEQARSVYAKTWKIAEAGSLVDQLSVAFVLADITIGLGRLNDAERVCERALQGVPKHFSAYTSGVEDIHRMRAEIALERGLLEEAAQHLDRTRAAGEVSLVMGWRYRYLVSLARYEAFRGEVDTALLHLEEAERVYCRTPLPELRPLYAVRARVLLIGGRRAEAIRSMEQGGPVASESLAYPNEYAALSWVRVWVDSKTTDDGLLRRWLERATEAKRARSILEITLLQALQHHHQGATKAAHLCLIQAMELAAPAAHQQMFVSERATLIGLLNDVPRAALQTPFARELRRRILHPAAALDEALSVRELEVLELMAEGLSNAEIGARLFIALDTVKGHGRRIYRKLGVRRRTEAVAEARERQLLV